MLKAVILAAGKGTRMKSDKPKVVHQVMGKPMVYYSIEAAKKAGATDICVIVGYKADEVKAAINQAYETDKENLTGITYVVQTEQLGTGHAVKCASDFIGQAGDVVILCGDTPLVTADTLKSAVKEHKDTDSGVTVISAVLENPFGYGRIIKDANGLEKIVEEKDATEEEKKVAEVNSGMYVFKCDALNEALKLITNDNAQGEYYLPDTISIIKEKGYRAKAIPMKNSDEIRGVNTLEQLKEAEDIMSAR